MPVTVQLNRAQQKNSRKTAVLTAAAAVMTSMTSTSSMSSSSLSSTEGSLDEHVVEKTTAEPTAATVQPTLVLGNNMPVTGGVPQLQCTFSLTSSMWQLVPGQMNIAQMPQGQFVQMPSAPSMQGQGLLNPETVAELLNQQLASQAAAAPVAPVAAAVAAPAAPVAAPQPVISYMQIPAEWTLPGQVPVSAPVASKVGIPMSAVKTPEEAFRLGELNQMLELGDAKAINLELQARNVQTTGNVNLLMKGDEAMTELYYRYLTGGLSNPANKRARSFVGLVEELEKEKPVQQSVPQDVTSYDDDESSFYSSSFTSSSY